MRKKITGGEADGLNTPFKNGNLIVVLILGIFFAVFATGALTYAIARPHYWLRVDNAKITGGREKNAYVYRSSKGQILIHVVDTTGTETDYIYSSSIKVLAVAEANAFSFRNGFAFSKAGNPPVLPDKLRGLYNDPTLIIGEETIEFESDEGKVSVDIGEALKLDIPHNYF